MGESYPPGAGPGIELARELVVRLLPGADGQAIVEALMAEREAGIEPPGDGARDGAREGARELARLRALLQRGESARQLQHAFNNPLTALLAEAQLLEMDHALSSDVHAAAARILGLVRRLAALTRELDPDVANPRIG